MIQTRGQIVLQGLGGVVGNEDDTDFPPLSADGDLASAKIEVLAVQAAQLRETQAGGKEQPQHRVIALPFLGIEVRSCQQTL